MACGLAMLQGCANTPEQSAPDEESPDRIEPEPPELTFRLDVVSDNRGMARHLERHMELQRFTDFPDLQANELRRLLGEAEENARNLLAAQGYFDPRLDLRMEEPEDEGDTRRIVVEVETGRRTRIDEYTVNFAEPMAGSEEGERQREVIRRDWLLKENNVFTQTEWDAARNEGLRVLQRRRYPTARITHSQAIVNADTARALLEVDYDPGPLYRFGELDLPELERYSATGIRNIARIPTGEEYDEQTLLDAQQRLVSSGYFDSAFLMLDTEGSDPGNARVIAQLTEAEEQKIVFGLGYATDAGVRLSVDHTHNRMWPLRWRALNQLDLGTETQTLVTHWTDMPKASGWAWYTGMELSRSEYGDYNANSISLTGGRLRDSDRTERRYYVRYDASKAIGGSAPGGSSSMLANYQWTGRYFNNDLNPTRGRGFGIESGVGLTIHPDRDPFLRVVLRGLQFLPFGGRNAAGKRNRIVLRAEAGGIHASDDVNIPVPLLFLTGGDTTVRGYSYQSIGNFLDDGTVYGARYMSMGSIEWQRPLSLFGDAATWEHAVFVDAGAAADKLSDATVFTGVGTGIRWASPVGPLQADVAYGTETDKWRVHIRVGFQF